MASTVGCRSFLNGSPKRNTTSSACRNQASDEKFPADAIREAGYGAIWHGQKSYNGVAILARGKELRNAGVGSPAILMIPTAATLKPRWTG